MILAFQLRLFEYNVHIFFLFVMAFDFSQLSDLDLMDILACIERGEVTSQEVYQYFRNQSQERNPQLNAFIQIYDQPSNLEVNAALK